MSGETITLHGSIRNGAVVIDEDIRLPDGTPVRLVIQLDDLPASLRAELTNTGPGEQGSSTVIEQWEREE